MFKIYNRISNVDFRIYKELYSEQIEAQRLREYAHLSYAEGILRSEEDFWYDTEIFFKTTGAFICVWFCDGRYASALRAEQYNDGYLLTNLETDITYRNRGYATLLIQGLKKHLLSIGCKRLYAHISKCNQISIIVHEKLGFQRIFDSATLVDGTTTNDYYTYSVIL